MIRPPRPREGGAGRPAQRDSAAVSVVVRRASRGASEAGTGPPTNTWRETDGISPLAVPRFTKSM